MSGQPWGRGPVSNTLTPQPQLYDVSREIQLLESAPVQGRKTELRQLVKLVNQSRSGNARAVLLTGEPGIGKSALTASFSDIVRKGIYSRILDLRNARFSRVDEFYVAVMDGLHAEAEAILDEALIAVNEIVGEIDMAWERQDLMRAVSLVKLQESIGATESVNQEQLAKALRNSVPTVKKLKLSVNETINKLVDLIINPWIMMAAAIVDPIQPSLRDAFETAKRLKAFHGSVQQAATALPGSISTNGRGTGAADEDESPDEAVDPAQTVIHIDSAVSGAAVPGATTMTLEHARDVIKLEGEAGTLMAHTLNVFHFINNLLNGIDSSLVMVLDNWQDTDRLSIADREALKEFVAEFLRHTTEQRTYRLMVLVCSESGSESQTLGGSSGGGSLYNLFRTKLLLPGLTEPVARKAARQLLQDEGIELDDEVHRDIYTKTRGNPFWHFKFLRYIRERATSNKTDTVNREFFDKLGIEQLPDLLELSFTRVKLSLMNDEEALYRVIAVLLKQFGERSFAAADAIREISVSQGLADRFVFEVLRRLLQHDFLHEVPAPGKRREHYYRIESRQAWEFLSEKTRTIHTDISTDDKLLYLKKVIPLSVKSAELDREKTREVLALCHSLGNEEMVRFLEDVFLDHLGDERPMVRVTSLNNLALIDSERARNAIFESLGDGSSLVREYAARNLSMLSKKTTDPGFNRQVVERMVEYIDDDFETVRSQVYETLARYRWNHELEAVFVRGMSDASDAVRQTSVNVLAETESDSPFVKNSLLDAMDDANAEVRRYATLGIQRYEGPEIIEALVTRLRQDEESGIRAMAADALSRMEDDRAIEVLVSALYDESAEDVKLAIIRALGKRRGWRAEEILLNYMETPEEIPPALLWACVRSLGMVGGTERSLNLLRELQQGVENDIVRSAVDLALQKIEGRFDELRLLERQLEAATPVAQAVPSDYRDEVDVPVDMPLDREVIMTSTESSLGEGEPDGEASAPETGADEVNDDLDELFREQTSDS